MTTTRRCDCCENVKCNKIFRIPVGSPTKRIFRVCGRCVVYNAQKLRAWLDKKEEELK